MAFPPSFTWESTLLTHHCHVMQLMQPCRLKEEGKVAHGLRQTSYNVQVAWKQLSVSILLSLGTYKGIQANFTIFLDFVVLGFLFLLVQRELYYVTSWFLHLCKSWLNPLLLYHKIVPYCWQGNGQVFFGISDLKEVGLHSHPFRLFQLLFPQRWTGLSARKEAQLLWTQGKSTNLCKWQIWSIIVSVPRCWNASRCSYCRQGRRSHSFVLILYLCNAMEGVKVKKHPASSHFC